MATIPLSTLVVWIVIVAIAAGSFGMRLSFIVAFGYISTIPPRVRTALELVPPAVLTALIVPPVLLADGSLSAPLANDRLPAAIAAAIVAWRTESMIGTIAVGMGVLWTLRYLL